MISQAVEFNTYPVAHAEHTVADAQAVHSDGQFTHVEDTRY